MASFHAASSSSPATITTRPAATDHHYGEFGNPSILINNVEAAPKIIVTSVQSLPSWFFTRSSKLASFWSIALTSPLNSANLVSTLANPRRISSRKPITRSRSSFISVSVVGGMAAGLMRYSLILPQSKQINQLKHFNDAII